jgi:hypothetical protein
MLLGSLFACAASAAAFGGNTMPAFVQRLGRQEYDATFKEPEIADFRKMYVQ